MIGGGRAEAALPKASNEQTALPQGGIATNIGPPASEKEQESAVRTISAPRNRRPYT